MVQKNIFLIHPQKNIFFMHPNRLFCTHPALEMAADGLFCSFLLPSRVSTLFQSSEEQY